MTLSEKQELFQLFLSSLEKRLAVLVESAFVAKEASTNEESKAENKYDTRGLEASYLASGQAQRAQELKEKIYQAEKVEIRPFTESDPISVSAFLEIQIEEEVKKFIFLMPVGGVEIEYKDQKIQTMTIDAPLGQRLLGLQCGDDFDFQGKFYEILSVS
ncbi:MAG: transcription elongation factor GreAB [Pseudomonadota bacterium]